MGINQRLKSTIELFNRRYAVTLLAILWSNRQKSIEVNLDELYSGWQILRPSRTTFSTLIRDFEHLGVIRLYAGAKKSEKMVSINEEFADYSLLTSQATLDEFLLLLSENVCAR